MDVNDPRVKHNQLNGSMNCWCSGSDAPPSMNMNMKPHKTEAVDRIVVYVTIWNWLSFFDSHHLVKKPFLLLPRAIEVFDLAHTISYFPYAFIHFQYLSPIGS